MVSDFDPKISVLEFNKADDNDCCISKSLEISHKGRKFVTPVKTIEGRKINEKSLKDFADVKRPILEVGKCVTMFDSWNRLHYLLEEAEMDKTSGLNDFLGIRRKLWEPSLTEISFVFPRNPFVENVFPPSKKNPDKPRKIRPLERDSYRTLLDHIHACSKPFVLVPDIRIKEEKGKATIGVEEYLKHIDESVEILEQFNNKPIFVPIQIQLTYKKINRILEHYKKRGYTNIWVNFNGSHIHGTYFGRVRTLLSYIDYVIGLSNVVLYYSHTKKESNTDPRLDKAISSDILSQFFGADFIGVNRGGQGGGELTEEKLNELVAKYGYNTKEEYLEALNYHRNRLFDPTSYYYYKMSSYPNSLPPKSELLIKHGEINKLFNSSVQNKEVDNTKQFLLENGCIEPYVSKKDGFIENKNILDEVVPRSTQKGIFEYLDKF